MIPFDFEYYKPSSVAEAVDTYQSLSKQGKKVIYYSGGTEFITFSRINKMAADAVIDIKGIDECHALEVQGDKIVIGAAVSLNKIAESNLFPLLGDNVKQIADHTSRNKITIGGNLFSQLIYREGVLSLLLADAKVVIAGDEGETTLPLRDVFQKNMKVEKSSFLVRFIIDKEYAAYPFFTAKKTRSTQVGYPIVSIAALVKDKSIRIAFSGVCEYPFRCTEIESIINDDTLSMEERIKEVGLHLPAQVVDDMQGSANYRQFVLKNTLTETMESLEGYVK